jgi:hypothetical protein
MRKKLLIKEEIKVALRKLIKEGVTKKADFQSIGLGGVNEPTDVEHILTLFSDPKVGFADEIEKIKTECSPENDYTEIGECQKFQDFIGKYQREQVFPSGFSDSRIDPNRETITMLYNTILGTNAEAKEETPEAKTEFSDEIVPPKDWDTITNLIIDRLEGGYYHPDMKASLKGGENMYDSGETLFGIDRKHGGKNNTTPEGLAFWNTVDKNSGWSPLSKGEPKWKYNHVPKGSNLRKAAANVMLAAYNFNKKNIVKMDEKIEAIINSDARLQVHFAYGAWNGAGNFQILYNSLVNYIKNNPDYTMKGLLQDAMKARTRLIGAKRAVAHSAKKVSELINSLN